MENVSYKCPACAAPLKFSDKTQNWKCSSCSNEFTLQNLKDFYDDEILKNDMPLNWMEYDFTSGSGDWTESEKETLSESRCSSCGAEIIMDKNIAATKCVYCGNTVLLPVRFSGTFRPDYVIPFKYDKDMAIKQYKNFCAGKRLLPKQFLEQNHIEDITGIYVPFWLYNCDATGELVFNAKRVTSYNSGKYLVTHTDHYRINRAGNIIFSKIPVDGSVKIADEYMEAIEPFDYSQLEPFTPAYLSGFFADKYDFTAKEGQPRADERVRNSVRDMLTDTVSGYTSVSVSGESYTAKNTDIKYALLPVWILNTMHKDKPYTFAMNGQTGKLVGNLPVDKGRYFKYLLGIGLSASAAIYAAAAVLRLLGVI